MIYAELDHNPYIPDTTVKFNGKSPKINSQIEKYYKLPLKDWVHKVPEIFYNEMNGYGFDLLFIGRDSDYEEVCHAFSSAGVSEDDVRVIHKHKLEDAETKSSRIDDLISWLKDVPNRRFDFASFWEIHSDLFESTYPYIIIGGEAPGYLNPSIGVELVDNMSELSTTDLTSTPILFVVDKQNYEQFREDIATVMKRSDIRSEQLFFMIRDSLDIDQVTRVISDMGIRNPQVVSQADDTRAIMYLKNYPVTEYIRDAIRVFRKVLCMIQPSLEKDNEESRKTNAKVYAIINKYEMEIATLKSTDEYLSESSSYYPRREIYGVQSRLKEEIKKWGNRKTKTTNEDDALSSAKAYSEIIKRSIKTYLNSIYKAVLSEKATIEKELRDKYLSSQIDSDFLPIGISFDLDMPYDPPNFVELLVDLKTVSYGVSKGDLFDVFRRPSQDNVKETIQFVTWRYEQWRNAVWNILEPMTRKIAENCDSVLTEYQRQLLCAYHAHVLILIKERQQLKDSAESQLSSDEQILQRDNDWFSLFKDRLTEIERG